MKKIIAISLVLFYQMATTELYQLLKLPFLIEHFMEHSQQNKDITFFDFIYLHYTEADDKDGDYEKDMKLPFKTHNSSVSTNIVAFVENTIVNIKLNFKPIFVELKSLIICKKVFFASSYLSNIWQPPKSN
ncbi:MAG: hypothetical protein V4585_16905 [Bacteroidota bacterium]